MEGDFLCLVTKDNGVRGVVEEACYKYINFGPSCFGPGPGWGSRRIPAGLSREMDQLKSVEKCYECGHIWRRGGSLIGGEAGFSFGVPATGQQCQNLRWN